MTLILGGTGKNSNNIFGIQGKVNLFHGNKGKLMRGSRDGVRGPEPPRKSRQRNTVA